MALLRLLFVFLNFFSKLVFFSEVLEAIRSVYLAVQILEWRDLFFFSFSSRTFGGMKWESFPLGWQAWGFFTFFHLYFILARCVIRLGEEGGLVFSPSMPLGGTILS